MGEIEAVAETDLTLPCLVHDLNNVFQTLTEAADLLSGDPRWSALSAAILRSVERGRNVTQSIQSTGDNFASLDQILNDAIAFVQDSLIGARNQVIQFERHIDPAIELRRTWAWERVFINLFSNSVRAMPAGGRIRVEAQRFAAETRIRVEDDGPGIPLDILPHVFEPHVSTRGSGLGLHIVRTIVKQDGGEVLACNRSQGRGAAFTITIPAESQPRAAHSG
jgi:signal transduction histidine kinase